MGGVFQCPGAKISGLGLGTLGGEGGGEFEVVLDMAARLGARLGEHHSHQLGARFFGPLVDVGDLSPRRHDDVVAHGKDEFQGFGFPEAPGVAGEEAEGVDRSRLVSGADGASGELEGEAITGDVADAGLVDGGETMRAFFSPGKGPQGYLLDSGSHKR